MSKIEGVHRSTGIARPKMWERARYYNEGDRLIRILEQTQGEGEAEDDFGSAGEQSPKGGFGASA